MLVFNVRCRVLEPIQVTDAEGRDVTIEPGIYRLQGVEHLVRQMADGTTTQGTDITFVGEADGRAAYTVSADQLAHFIAADDVEIPAI